MKCVFYFNLFWNSYLNKRTSKTPFSFKEIIKCLFNFSLFKTVLFKEKHLGF